MTSPADLRARADALDALRPGTDGDGWDGAVVSFYQRGPNDPPGNGWVPMCKACNRVKANGHEDDCENLADSALKHDGAQALRREAALVEHMERDVDGPWLTSKDILEKLESLHADPAGQER